MLYKKLSFIFTITIFFNNFILNNMPYKAGEHQTMILSTFSFSKISLVKLNNIFSI